MLCDHPLLAQESELPVTTRDVQGKIEQQLKHNDQRLLDAMKTEDTLGDSLMQALAARAGVVPRPRGREVLSTVRSGDTLDMSFPRDAAVSVLDRQSTKGMLLTGKWILDYAKMIKLGPEYEKTLASYRGALDIQKGLTAELEGVIGIKDKKIDVLQEMNNAQQKRGDLYKTLSEVNQESWFEQVLHKIAFPAGLAIGIVVGVVITK